MHFGNRCTLDNLQYFSEYPVIGATINSTNLLSILTSSSLLNKKYFCKNVGIRFPKYFRLKNENNAILALQKPGYYIAHFMTCYLLQ